ncbi:uncharacterized protein Z520_04224 [Fonsecaea multimorphosa CBS 102226]|uniref:Capsule synthesis protein CapA domain-containing protein n=1 Tax=Fonsecaea multimorphosa CBS 102226 TaxID=1442371 RepID=A0A0D2IRF2_9EURO|nr:uncharacterized protein Z520_04224 [Fonsecaea multimorphosa CBS 102226]KIX99591.1 hypothetical protein Z520_04224 [Fonsecaea multimorphosa CBS 102226]OAL26831.1 hypothetical protein AYO22_03998 [Fonsecaea multimorphosa]
MSKRYSLLLLGDVMIGRLIDALLPTSIARQSPHSDPESAAWTVDKHILPRSPQLESYNYLSPWGNSVELIRKSDLVLANLETAVTTSEKKWPSKVFNYRTHPGNVQCLTEVGLGGGNGRGYVSLANNHTLDWSVEGLQETVQTLIDNGVEFAGAGRTKEEAARPATLSLGGADGWHVKCWSFADHPSEWGAVDAFNLVDYTGKGRDTIREQLLAKDHREEPGKLGLKVVSMHWGPNYRWHPAKEIVDLAHWMIDECGVDIIHGHSSHHVQGVEIYKEKLVVYGCGDFVDDYAVDPKFRNDLSAAWKISVGERTEKKAGESELEVKRLEVYPNRIERFQAHLLKEGDPDHEWVEHTFRRLCHEFGTQVEKGLGDEGQIVVHVKT